MEKNISRAHTVIAHMKKNKIEASCSSLDEHYGQDTSSTSSSEDDFDPEDLWKWLVFKPKNMSYNCWTFWIFFLELYLAFAYSEYAVYEFPPWGSNELNFLIVAEVFMMFDIIGDFFKAYKEDGHEQWVMDPKKIAVNNWESRRFRFEFFVLIPWGLTTNLAP